MNKIRIPKLYQLAVRFPVLVLLLILFVSAFSLHYAKKLHVEGDLTALLPKNTESVRNLQEMRKYFGGRGYLAVSVEGNNTTQVKQFANLFATRIEKLPEISYVDYQPPVQFFEQRQWLFVDVKDLEEIEKRVTHSLALEKQGVSTAFNDLTDFADPENRPDLEFKDILSKYEKKAGIEAKKNNTNEEGTFIVLKVKAKEHAENVDSSRKLISDLEKIAAEIKGEPFYQNIQVGYSGDYKNSIEDADETTREVSQVSVIVTLLLFVVLFFYFRNFSSLLLIGIPLVIGVLWTGAVLYFVFGHLSLITAFGAAILSGLGSDYGIYLLSEYYQKRKEGDSLEIACHAAFGSTGQATHASMVITVGAFIALLFSDFGVFIELGVMGAAGLFANYLAMVLFMPSLLVLMNRFQNRSEVSLISRFENFFESFKLKLLSMIQTVFTPKNPTLLIVTILVLCGLSLIVLPQQSKIYFQDGQLSMKRKGSPELERKVNEVAPRSFNPTILLVKGSSEEAELVKKLDLYIQSKSADQLIYNQVLGLSSFVPTEQDEKKEILKRIRKKYEKLKFAVKEQKKRFLETIHSSIHSATIHKENLPEAVRRNFQSHQDKNFFAVLIFPKDASSSSENLRKLHEGIKEIQHELKADFIAADSNFVADDTIRLIEKEAPKGILMFLVFLAVILFMIVRPLHRAPIIFFNLVAGLVLLMGVLWLFNIRLNVMNIALFPIVLGTAIDCFIHFNHRYNETKDVVGTVKEEIPPMFVSSLTSMIGFGGLLLTSSSGLRSIGWVAVIGLLIVTLFCDLLIPRSLMWIESYKKARSYKMEEVAEG